MKTFLISLLKTVAATVANLGGGSFTQLFQFVITQLEALDIKDVNDPRWSSVAPLVTDLLRDVELATAADPDLAEALRRAAEVRFTRTLRDLGLLQVT